MSFTKKALAAASAFALLGGGAVALTQPVVAHDHKSAEKSAPTIVGVAQSTGVHTTLVAAVQAAGLVETLSGNGPFTVFAPTDDAFGKLPHGTVDTLLLPENKATLTNVLTYHAVAGSVTAADLVGQIEQARGAITVDTLAGEKLTVSRFGDTLAITDATGRTTVVATADVKASNGIVHVVDGVFLPG
ncbi:fasciclin domain-containing protein [Erythrobacter litoralis]|uniref:FAS1 domain-containing protein n=1 Tax=Erythrobacter litoralis (strain HTCC2594) TaxID=314225 RepID=Q2NDB9_ERYLH|nr:fasciclin domain-containing protein [Erythrobacter litoralis]ABC62322.1 hypothetical protein ELI_01150 [Erythrobacter litoralis HTCC2594]